jgi:hypothetical protein
MIAEHADIEDEGQAVTFKAPKIGTKAHGKDGNKIIPLDEKAIVIDIVKFENLVAFDAYTLKGILMDKETGKPVLVDGKEVTAETAFTAKESSGSTEVVFTFDSTGLESKILVVFEYLYYRETLITEHTDINDEAQTVTIAEREPENPGGGAQTGRDGLPVRLLILGIGAVVMALLLKLYLHYRRRDK